MRGVPARWEDLARGIPTLLDPVQAEDRHEPGPLPLFEPGAPPFRPEPCTPPPPPPAHLSGKGQGERSQLERGPASWPSRTVGRFSAIHLWGRSGRLGPPTPRVSLWKNFGPAMWNLRSWCVEEFVWNFLWPISLEIEGRKSTEIFAKISPRFSSVSLKISSKNFTWISLWGTIGIRKGSLQKIFLKCPRNFRKLSAECLHPVLAQ